MSTDADIAFVAHLQRLHDQDRGALATLRHSLAFAPGDHPRSFAFVERFVGRDWHALDSRRLALYAVAGLFAANPIDRDVSLAAAMGELVARKDRPSLELRFIALLEADADGVMNHLRQAVSLLAAEGMGYDHAELLQSLRVALNDKAPPEWRDALKRRWARDFYRAQQPGSGDMAESAANTTTE